MPRKIVLCYHAVSPTWRTDISALPERFEQQMSLMLARGYRPVSFSEAVWAPPEAPVVAITFDDAFLSVLTFAWPIMERLGMPGTLFVPTDYIDSGGRLQWPGIDEWLGSPSEPELAPMSWAQIRSLAAAGWEIGSHTGSHPHLTSLDDATLADELTRSKAMCERELGAPCPSVAYPFGDVDARVVTAAARAGYVTAAALPDRQSSRDPLEWPRVGIYDVDDALRFRAKVSPAVQSVRSSRAWDLLKASRSWRDERGQA